MCKSANWRRTRINFRVTSKTQIIAKCCKYVQKRTAAAEQRKRIGKNTEKRKAAAERRKRVGGHMIRRSPGGHLGGYQFPKATPLAEDMAHGVAGEPWVPGLEN